MRGGVHDEVGLVVGFVMGHHSRQSPLVQTTHTPPMVTRETFVSFVSCVRKQCVDAVHARAAPRPEGDLDRRAFISRIHSASTRDDDDAFEFDAFVHRSFIPRACVRSFLDVRPSIHPSVLDAVDVDDDDGPRAPKIELARVRRER